MPTPEKNQPSVTDVPAAGDRLACFALIDAPLGRVQQRLAEILAEPDPQIRQAIESLLASPGKMIRPGLVLLSGACAGDLQHEHIDLAAMVELIHRASLLHDDVIDGASTRRQGPTANARWGNTIAVLLGDYLLSRAFYLGLSVQVDTAGEILSHTARDICRGELQQNFRKGQWDLSFDDYYRMIEAKTAALFVTSCRLGAAASQASPQQQESLAQFGRHLGMAFQIRDDLLDIIGADDRAGKTLGTDLTQGKLTLPVIHWLRQDPQTMADRIARLQDGCERDSLIEAMTTSGSLDFSFTRIEEHIQKARTAIDGMDNNPAVRSLHLLAEHVGRRFVRQ